MWQDMERMTKFFQQGMERYKKYLEEARFSGESDDGKVLVLVNGLGEIVNINFYHNELCEKEKLKLELSTLQAANKALSKAREMIKQKTCELTGVDLSHFD